MPLNIRSPLDGFRSPLGVVASGLTDPPTVAEDMTFQSSGAIFPYSGWIFNAGIAKGLNNAAVPVAITAPDAGDVYVRAVVDGTTTEHVTWTLIGSPGAAGDFTYTFNVPYYRGLLRIDVAQSGNTYETAAHRFSSGARLIFTDQSEIQRLADNVNFQGSLTSVATNDNHIFKVTRQTYTGGVPANLDTYDIDSTGLDNPSLHGMKAVWSAVTSGIPVHILFLTKGQSSMTNALTDAATLRSWLTDDTPLWNEFTDNEFDTEVDLVSTGWSTDEVHDIQAARYFGIGYTGYDSLDNGLFSIPGDNPIVSDSGASSSIDHTYREFWGDGPKMMFRRGHAYVAYNLTADVSSISEASPAVLTLASSESNTADGSIVHLRGLDDSTLPENTDIYVDKISNTVYNLYQDEDLTTPYNNVGGGAASAGKASFRYNNGYKYPDDSKHFHWWQKGQTKIHIRDMEDAPSNISSRLAGGQTWPGIFDYRIGDQANSMADDQHQGDKDDGEGLVRFGAELMHYTTRAMGLASWTMPTIDRTDVYWEPAGAYVEITWDGGDFTTHEKQLGITVPNKSTMKHRTDVMGFEINERPAERVEIVDTNGDSATTGKIRIYPDPLSAFLPDTKLRFGLGGGRGELSEKPDQFDEVWRLYPCCVVNLPGTYYSDGGEKTVSVIGLDPPEWDVFGNQLDWSSDTFNVTATDTVFSDDTIEWWHNDGPYVEGIVTLAFRVRLNTANTTSSVQSIFGIGPDLECRLGVRANTGEIIYRVEDSAGILKNATSTGVSIGLDTWATVRMEVDLTWNSGEGVIRVYVDDVEEIEVLGGSFDKTHNGQIGGRTKEMTVFDGNFDDLDFQWASAWFTASNSTTPPSKTDAFFMLGGNAAAANANRWKSGTDVT